MAETRFIQPYAALEQHRAEMQRALHLRRVRVGLAVVGGSLATALVYWLFAPMAMLVAGVSALVIFFSSITGGSSVEASEMAGVEGEVRVLEFLKRLPAEYVLFNQVHIPDDRLPNARRELDFIVLGPSGLHVIEVKNTPGLIYVLPQERRWPLAHKAGCGGRPGWNAIDNPLLQVRAQTDALARWLLLHSLVCSPQPVVCFARPDVALRDRDQTEIPVLTAAELPEHLQEPNPTIPIVQREAIIRLLAGATGQTLARAA